MDVNEKELRKILTEYITPVQKQLTQMNDSIGWIRTQLEQQRKWYVRLNKIVFTLLGLGLALFGIGLAIVHSTSLYVGFGTIILAFLIALITTIWPLFSKKQPH